MPRRSEEGDEEDPVTSMAAITVLRPRAEVQRLWEEGGHRPSAVADGSASARFADAPGDRGTEVHVELVHPPRGGVLAGAVRKARGTDPLATLKDDLRRFKQHAETGSITRSDGTPEGESLHRKLRQRPAHPLSATELAQVRGR
jgi:hypothetical protein